MSEALFVLAVGAFAGTVYCAGHALMVSWYRRRARRKFEKMARPWWVVTDEEERRNR